MKTAWPTDFVAQLGTFLPPSEHLDFLEALESPSPVSLQMHPHKASSQLQSSSQVPWYAQGRYLAERPVFTLDPAFHAGAYYVQEAASMFIGYLAEQLLPKKRPWRILDLCAAPGGKSCQLAAIAPPGSLLISNEIIKNRQQILRYNIAKWGYDQCWTSSLDPSRFSSLIGFFDLVLVDAPCSGEGLFRKDEAAREEWSAQAVDFCSLRQDRILREAAPLVKEGGLLLYSTCTYNRKENEQQALLLEQELGFQITQPTIPNEWNIEAQGPGYRFFPHRLASEGFYALAAIQRQNKAPVKYKSKALLHWQLLDKSAAALVTPWLKNGQAYAFYQDSKGLIYALHQDRIEDAGILAAALGQIDLGFPVGTLKGKQLVPAPELAFHLALAEEIPSFSVDKSTALQLLKCELPPLPQLEKGRYLVTYEGLGLLWINAIGHRYNNNYPSAWRIRMQL